MKFEPAARNVAAGIKNTDCYAFMRNDNTLQVNQNTLLRQSDNQQPLALQEMMKPMKRKAIRNRDQERVLDILVDKDKDKIVLETKIGRQTRHIEYDTFIKQIEQITEAN